jgi:hypothetical protein
MNTQSGVESLVTCAALLRFIPTAPPEILFAPLLLSCCVGSHDYDGGGSDVGDDVNDDDDCPKLWGMNMEFKLKVMILIFDSTMLDHTCYDLPSYNSVSAGI